GLRAEDIAVAVRAVEIQRIGNVCEKHLRGLDIAGGIAFNDLGGGYVHTPLVQIAVKHGELSLRRIAHYHHAAVQRGGGIVEVGVQLLHLRFGKVGGGNAQHNDLRGLGDLLGEKVEI